MKYIDEIDIKGKKVLIRTDFNVPLDEEGNITDAANPNGALYNIAGICNANRNVFGMMPHPERASEEILKNTDGRLIFQSFLKGVPVGV